MVQTVHILDTKANIKTQVRDQFPILQKNPDIVYLDSASSTQKPSAVIDSISEFYTDHYANPGRGVYAWAQQTDALIETVRAKASAFIGASDSAGTLFTSGATMSLNMVASAWGANNLRDGDEVLYCPLDHSSMVLPWVALQKNLAARDIHIVLKPYKLKSDGGVDLENLLRQVTAKTRLVNITHIHNVAGVLNDVATLRADLPDHVMIHLDAAQSISHVPVDIAQLGVQFLSFSGHKMFSANGVGILWVAPALRHNFGLFMTGGGQAASKHADSFHRRTEAGTQNLGAIASLGAAIDFMNALGRPWIERHLHDLTIQLHHVLLRNPRVDMLFRIKEYELERRQGIAAFKVEGFADSEVGDFLASQNVFVRYGQHCAGEGYQDPLQPHLDDSVRVSLNVYNTVEDINRLNDLICGMND